MRKSRPTEPEPTFAADEVAVAARAQNTVQNIPIGYDGQMTAVDPRVFLVGGAGLQVHRQLAAVCLAHGIALPDLRMKSQRFLSAPRVRRWDRQPCARGELLPSLLWRKSGSCPATKYILVTVTPISRHRHYP